VTLLQLPRLPSLTVQAVPDTSGSYVQDATVVRALCCTFAAALCVFSLDKFLTTQLTTVHLLIVHGLKHMLCILQQLASAQMAAHIDIQALPEQAKVLRVHVDVLANTSSTDTQKADAALSIADLADDKCIHAFLEVEAASALVGLLQSQNSSSNARASAVVALGEWSRKEGAVPAVFSAGGAEPLVGALAAPGSSLFMQTRAVLALAALLSSSGHEMLWEQRAPVVVTAMLNTRDAIPRLLCLLQSTQPRILPLVLLLMSILPMQLEATKRMAAAGAVPQLVRLIRSGTGGRHTRALAAEVLKMIHHRLAWMQQQQLKLLQSQGEQATELCAGCSASISREPMGPDNNGRLYRCSSCMCVRYCSVACQRRHWREHKQFCVCTT
jgi:hypothetical protein